MNISSFEDLLGAAREQPEPQRLLFVFADAMLPDDSTSEQRACFDAGQGGALMPCCSTDAAMMLRGRPNDPRGVVRIGIMHESLGSGADRRYPTCVATHASRRPAQDLT